MLNKYVNGFLIKKNDSAIVLWSSYFLWNKNSFSLSNKILCIYDWPDSWDKFLTHSLDIIFCEWSWLELDKLCGAIAFYNCIILYVGKIKLHVLIFGFTKQSIVKHFNFKVEYSNNTSDLHPWLLIQPNIFYLINFLSLLVVVLRNKNQEEKTWINC